jgi:N-acyl-D-amino-acid deacylase
VQRIMAFDETMIGSDGIPLGDKPHPRLWGTFPRVLGHYSRDLGLFPLETAVWKMTGLTAQTFGLARRSTLAVGHHADVVVFDAQAIRDTATYDQPARPPQASDTVVVNGVLAWQIHKSSRHHRLRPLAGEPHRPCSPFSSAACCPPCRCC